MIPALYCSIEQAGNVEKAGSVQQAVGSANLKLNLEKAPRLNEPVKLTCLRQTKNLIPPGQLKKTSDNTTGKNISSDNESEANSIPPGLEKPKKEKITLKFERIDPKTKALIEVPAEEVIVGGNYKWEGDVTGQPLEFSATLKFPYEGNWGIYAQSAEDSWDRYDIFLNIGEDSSSFGWPPDYRPHTSHNFPITPGQRWPIAVELDIPKPPRLNEPVQLTWSLNSIRDIDGVISEVNFFWMQGTDYIKVPAEDMLLEGDLSWKGSLKKGNTLNFAATVNFKQEGDWAISAIADSYAEPEPINASSRLYLHIDKDKSRWGWTEPHEKPYEGPPPLPDNAR
jgi:hypothetical protein